jgi:hypothetical protein
LPRVRKKAFINKAINTREHLHPCPFGENEMQAKRLTPADIGAGYVKCHDCDGEFSHVFSQAAMQKLPKTYSGEMCRKCNLWMCRTDMLASPVEVEVVA